MPQGQLGPAMAEVRPSIQVPSLRKKTFVVSLDKRTVSEALQKIAGRLSKAHSGDAAGSSGWDIKLELQPPPSQCILSGIWQVYVRIPQHPRMLFLRPSHDNLQQQESPNNPPVHRYQCYATIFLVFYLPDSFRLPLLFARPSLRVLRRLVIRHVSFLSRLMCILYYNRT